MLRINPEILVEIAANNGWLHETGKLRGTINMRQMALGLNVSITTVIRAYEDGATGVKFLGIIQEATGKSFDEIIQRVAA